jgi:hypothetical protein
LKYFMADYYKRLPQHHNEALMLQLHEAGRCFGWLFCAGRSGQIFSKAGSAQPITGEYP